MLKNFLVTLLLLAASVIPSLGQTLLSIQVNPPQVTGFVGNTYGLQVLGTYSDGSIQDLTNSATWTSSNSTAVSVVQTFPQVTVLAQNGNETVTLIANSGVVGVQPATMQFTAIAAPNTLDTGGPTVHLRGGSQGAPPFSTITSGTVDSLNIATSDILVRIPVRSKDEIIPFEFSLVGNSNAVALPTNPFPWFVSTGIHGVVSGMLMDQVGTSHKTTQCHGLADATYTNFSVIEADGTQHPSTNPTLQVDDGVMYNGVLTHCQRTSVSLGTTDNSGLTFTWGVGNTVNKIQDQHGNTLTWGQPVNGQNSAILTDKNGNVMKNVPTSTGWKIVDAENVTVITATIHGAGNGTTDTYSYVDDTGTTQKYIVTYAGWTAKSVFGCGDQDFSGPANQYFLPISVTVPQLPNDSAAGTYQFYYESTGSGNDTSGRISSILYPTGGQTSYSYVWNGSAPINCTDHLTVPVMTHYLTPGGEWNYTNSGITGNYQTETVSVLQPDNNTTTYSFSEDYATEKNVASIEDTYVCYNGIASKSSCVGGVSNIGAFVNQTDVYISAANGAANTYNHVQTLFSSDRVTGKTLWDFPGTGTAKTTTNIQYETINGDSDLPTSIQVLDPTNGNAQVALTAISYDSYGNPSSTSKWISGSGSLSLSLTTNYVYNQNGTLKTITDPSGLTTTVDYNGACNSLVPTGTTNSFNSLVTAESYDSPCRVGQAISQTPFSGFPSSQTYDDPWLRIDTATDAAGNTVTIKRGLNNRVETTPFNSNITLTHIVSLDGLGRTVDDQTFNGTYYDTVQTAYDNMGRVSYVSAPFQCATAGYCTGGAGTTWTYDAAGRVYIVQDANGGTITHTYAADSSGVWTKTVLTPTPSGDQSTNGKTAITLTNGLGQQMESCAVNTYSDASACGSGFSGNGYITSYTYDALGDMLTQTRGVQVRTSTYDGVRRITSSKNPESGTTTYTYDLADSKCSSYVSAGRLVEVTDANSNVTCPQYDGLGRVVLKTYGGNANTDTVGFSYDAATDGLGLLSEAWTCSAASYPNSCPESAWKTDDKLSVYDVRGNLVTIKESTPLFPSGATYTESYDTLNNVASVTGSNIFTWGPTAWDGEGRPVTVTNLANVIIQASATYNLHTVAGGSSVATYGNGDIVTTTYDNVGNLLTENINIGGSGVGVKDTLTWNANGTLKTLVRVNSYLSTTNTITYHYDDLLRLLSASSSDGALNQNYVYDMYDNITNVSPNNTPNMYVAGVNQNNNNRLNLGNCTSTGPCYDAAGHITIDQYNNPWTWDVNGQVVNSPAGSFTKDAFGRTTDNGYNTQFWVPNFSQRYVDQPTNGGYSTSIEFTLPGGSAVMWGSYNGLDQGFEHPDYLGNQILNSYYPNTDGTGAYASSRSYSPFGQQFDINGTTTYGSNGFNGLDNPFNDTQNYGPIWDTPARRLDPVAGRWTSPDPARSGWNQYSYAGNNPTIQNDPSGLSVSGCSTPGDNCTPSTPTLFDTVSAGLWSWLSGGVAPNPGSTPHYTVDGVDTPAPVAKTLLGSGAAAKCPNNDCLGVKLNMLGEFYRDVYNANPDIFQYDDSGFYPTHWVSTYLGNAGDGLPSSVLCVYIGSTCDVPLSGALFQSNRRLWQQASMTVNRLGGATAVVVASPFAIPAAGALNNATIEGAAYLESAGVPVTAGATWTINNWRTVTTAMRVGGWIWNNWINP